MTRERPRRLSNDAHAMIDPPALRGLIRQTIPDAEVQVVDLTGTMDHYSVVVTSSAFAGKSPLDRHRLVERAVAAARADGSLHALAIDTLLPE